MASKGQMGNHMASKAVGHQSECWLEYVLGTTLVLFHLHWFPISFWAQFRVPRCLVAAGDPLL